MIGITVQIIGIGVQIVGIGVFFVKIDDLEQLFIFIGIRREQTAVGGGSERTGPGADATEAEYGARSKPIC